MRCEFCGCEMPADHRFCRHCGRPLKEDPCCAACGAAIPPDGQFCPVCGTSVKSPAPKKDRTAAIVVLAAALLVVILVVLIVLVLVSKPKPEPVASQPEEIVEPAEAPETSLADSAAQVLYLDVYDPDQNYLGCASGFLVNDDTTLVTNYHVIEDAAYVLAFRDQSKHGVRAETLLAADEDADLAVLRCEESPGVQPLTLTDSDTVKQGDTVYAAGYPLGVANTLSNGILSSRYTDELGVDTLQHTAPISEGSSGGALLNEQGQVIGVTCATYVDGQNMNLAIAANVLAELLEEAPLDLPLYAPCTHEYGPWETVKEATCTEEGEMITHCTLCDEPMTRTTSPAPHTLSTTETIPATCEKEGKEVQTCEICGHTVTKTLPATGHDYANGFCTVCKKSDGTTPTPQQTPSIGTAPAGGVPLTDHASAPVISSEMGFAYEKFPTVPALDSLITDRSEVSFSYESYHEYLDTYTYCYETKDIDTAKKYVSLYHQYLKNNGFNSYLLKKSNGRNFSCYLDPTQTYQFNVSVTDYIYPAITIYIIPLSDDVTITPMSR